MNQRQKNNEFFYWKNKYELEKNKTGILSSELNQIKSNNDTNQEIEKPKYNSIDTMLISLLTFWLSSVNGSALDTFVVRLIQFPIILFISIILICMSIIQKILISFGGLFNGRRNSEQH